jgi:hypothetical protein
MQGIAAGASRRLKDGKREKAGFSRPRGDFPTCIFMPADFNFDLQRSNGRTL